MPPSVKRKLPRHVYSLARQWPAAQRCAVGHDPCCPVATSLKHLRPNRGAPVGPVKIAPRGANQEASGRLSPDGDDVTALEIAISAAAAFAPHGGEWEMAERAEFEVAFEVTGERLALTLIGRSPDALA
jgi:hypothetical protein